MQLPGYRKNKERKTGSVCLNLLLRFGIANKSDISWSILASSISSYRREIICISLLIWVIRKTLFVSKWEAGQRTSRFLLNWEAAVYLSCAPVPLLSRSCQRSAIRCFPLGQDFNQSISLWVSLLHIKGKHSLSRLLTLVNWLSNEDLIAVNLAYIVSSTFGKMTQRLWPKDCGLGFYPLGYEDQHRAC